MVILVYSPEVFSWVQGEELQQHRDGLITNIFLLHPQRHTVPTRTALSAARKTEMTGGCGADSQGEDFCAQLASRLYWDIASSAGKL